MITTLIIRKEDCSLVTVELFHIVQTKCMVSVSSGGERQPKEMHGLSCFKTNREILKETERTATEDEVWSFRVQ